MPTRAEEKAYQTLSDADKILYSSGTNKVNMFGERPTAAEAAVLAKVKAAASGKVSPDTSRSPISMSDLNLLEQRAYSGAPNLSAEDLLSVTGGGTSTQLPVTTQRARSVDSGTTVAQAQTPTLADHRARFYQEIQDNPDLARRLIASTKAEVGTQGEEAQQAYLESVMNRATARRQTLLDTISDPNYYPPVTLRRLGDRVSEGDQNSIGSLVTKVLGGSNITNYATGNESGSERSGGAAISHTAGGERFVQENPDRGWIKKMVSGPQPVDTGVSSDQEPGTGPITITRVDRSKVKTPTGRGDLSSTDEMTAARARTEDHVQALSEAGTRVTEKDYQAIFDRNLQEIHALNVPAPGAKIVSVQPEADTAEARTASRDLTARVMKGDYSASSEEVMNLARQQANNYVATLAKQGVPINEKEYAAEVQNFYNGLQKQNIGIQPERMPTDQADQLSALRTGFDMLDSINKTHHLANSSGGMLNQNSDEYKAFQAQRQLSLSPLARGLGGQKGVLSDKDAETVKTFLPNEWDSDNQAIAKVQMAKQQSLEMMRDKIAYMKASHYDVSEFERQYNDAKDKFTADIQGAKDRGTYVTPTIDVTQFKMADSAIKDFLKTQTGQTPAPAPASDQNAKVAAPVAPALGKVSWEGAPIPPEASPQQPQQPNIFETETRQTLPPTLPPELTIPRLSGSD